MPGPTRTLYDFLGVTPTASSDEIAGAYKKLALKLHPDHGGTSALFSQLLEARDVLSDPERRAAYDRSLKAPASHAEPVQAEPTQSVARSRAPKRTPTGWGGNAVAVLLMSVLDYACCEHYGHNAVRGTISAGAFLYGFLGWMVGLLLIPIVARAWRRVPRHSRSRWPILTSLVVSAVLPWWIGLDGLVLVVLVIGALFAVGARNLGGATP